MPPEDSQPRRPRKKRERPLFDEDVEQQLNPDAPSQAGCGVPGCKLAPPPSGKFCVLHEAIDGGKKKWQKSQQQAARRGDAVASVGWQLLGGLVDLFSPAITDMVNRAADDPAAAATRAKQTAQAAYSYVRAAPPPPPTPPTPKPDPFFVLGLNRETATAADVRQMQRKLAAIYHADKGNDVVATQKLAEINAAAAECLKTLKK